MDKTEKIIGYLRAKYHPEAILLTGSRVGRHFQDDSDWDLIVFATQVQASTRSLDHFDGEYLDIECKPYPPPTEYHLLSAALTPIEVKVLFDATGGIIDSVIQRTQKIRDDGPEKVSERKYLSRKNYLLKKLRKLRSATEKPGVFFYYLSQYYPFVISLWFELREQWPQRIYEALPYMQEHDPEFYGLLEMLITGYPLSERAETATKIYEYLFGE